VPVSARSTPEGRDEVSGAADPRARRRLESIAVPVQLDGGVAGCINLTWRRQERARAAGLG
jgi:hypothetical protein